MDIQIFYHYRKQDLEQLPLYALSLFVLEQEDLPKSTEVSISFVDDASIRTLNRDFRGIDSPTDVLSFVCDGADDEFGSFIAPEHSLASRDTETKFENKADNGSHSVVLYELGDIVIAPDVAERQTVTFGTTFAEEISLLLVHGLLHLCGYDHVIDDEAEAMEERERTLLSAFYHRPFIR